MKERFKKVKRVIDGCLVFVYIKEFKKHWWAKWKVVMDGAVPLIFYKLPEGMRAVNELPKYHFSSGIIPQSSMLPPPPFHKGDPVIRASMMDMVRNADEIYVGILQDGKYYLANDTTSIESFRDLKSLEIDEDGETDR